LQGPGGTGARANGHEGDYHDGLCSLYHFRTLFHGASAHPKETGSEVAGVKSYFEKKDVPFRRIRLRSCDSIPDRIVLLKPPFRFLLPQFKRGA